ncbi:MAG TPA: tRNA (adenosine(37)-N6)-threonylcarbamoyltransferase complex transferase subunit TsaD [Candidatus Saccharimonadales bacterium]|nr:tRNA (adenosine(37)-N6)-threonylcarbamoyltransferase complex transferase subunit TsaD [Candidatus Saccharimonadales bacterium]
MLILGIESSCDETAAAVVRDGHELLSNVVNSQIDIHSAYGGVIPEIAARSHIEVILPVIEKALVDAHVTWDDIDAMAVTHAPGLIGSLLIGSLAARTLAYIKSKPLYGIHHVEAHTYANFLTSGIKLSIPYPEKQPEFPLLSLTVSGGHSQLVLFEGHGKYSLLGQTRDDAVGEAFDKVAKIIGLPYPGGPSIAKAAEAGDAQKYALPKAKLQNPYDFSFSGLKTAVLRAVQRECGVDHTFPSFKLSERLDDVKRSNFAASFQRIAVETLVDKTVKAYREFQPKSVVIAGGVAANQELRRQLSHRLPTDIAYAPMELCTDNGAMIAALGYYQAKLRSPDNPLTLSVVPSLSMTKTSWQ